jgi:hypothetical protein
MFFNTLQHGWILSFREDDDVFRPPLWQAQLTSNTDGR